MGETTPTDPTLRAFCRATGLVFQTVGGILVLGTCCWGFVSVFISKPIEPTGPHQTIVDVWADSPGHAVWAMTAFFMALAAGLAGMTAGLGLQHERPRAGRFAMIVSGVAALFFWCYLGSQLLTAPTAARIIIGAVMAAVWTVLFLLAGESARELKAHPPPNAMEQSRWTARDEDDLRRSASPPPPDRTNR